MQSEMDEACSKNAYINLVKTPEGKSSFGKCGQRQATVETALEGMLLRVWTEQGPVAGPCEHDDKALGSMKGR